jgi:hypothetical protein
MNNTLIKTKVKNSKTLEKALKLLELLDVEIISVETEDSSTKQSFKIKDKPNLTNFHQKMTNQFGQMPVLSEKEAGEILNKYYQNHV